MQVGDRVRIISTGYIGTVVSTYYLQHLGGVTVAAGHPNWNAAILQWCLTGDLKRHSDKSLSLMEDLELIIGELK